MERKAIFVSPQTHQEFKELSVKEQKTFDQMVEKLVAFYKANK